MVVETYASNPSIWERQASAVRVAASRWCFIAADHWRVSCSIIPSSSGSSWTPTKPLRDGFDVVEDIFEIFDASLEVRQFR